MPTITFTFADFQNLLGKKLSIPEFEDLIALYAKAEVEGYDKRTDELSVKMDDTNLPFLWCPEGLARLLKGMLGMQKGIAALKVEKSSYKVVVDSSVRKVRPCITAFVAKGKRLDDYTLKQLVQMQEKFCEGYGRRRQKVSIGLYSYKRITFPVHYKAVTPDSVKFRPLAYGRELTLKQIIEQHPKGQQYGWMLKGCPVYPILMDDKNEILSFPPIINSDFTGKLEIGDDELLFEATGTDEESICLAASIFAQNLAERGFRICSVTISHKEGSVVAPVIRTEKVKVDAQQVEGLLGIKLTAAQLKVLLQKAGYDVRDGYAIAPHYRADVMHPVDALEDVAIAFGFDKMPDEPLTGYMVGRGEKAASAINALRKIVIGMGFQEIFSHILTDKSRAIDTRRAVELDNSMSETFSAVRDSILPQLLDVLARNKHADYPQKAFEEGLVAVREANSVMEYHSLALVSAHPKADFTEQKQYLAGILNALGIKFSIKPAEHPLFLKGRVGSIIVNGRSVGIIGELSPATLAKWEIGMPATATELNLNLLLSF